MANHMITAKANGEALRGMVAFGSESVAIPITFAAGQSVSSAATLDSAIPVRLSLPAGFVGNGVEFLVSQDGEAFADLYDSSGTKVRVWVSAGAAVRLAPAEWLGIKAVKIRAMLDAAAQAQAVERTAIIVAVP